MVIICSGYSLNCDTTRFQVVSIIYIISKNLWSDQVGKQTFDNIRKRLAILLLVCFTVSLTAAAVCADQEDYERGYKEGIKEGYTAGYESCKQEAAGGAAREAAYSIKPVGPSDYTDGYTDGYDIGFGRGQRAAGCYTNSKVLNN
jgi:hypothetical protein